MPLLVTKHWRIFLSLPPQQEEMIPGQLYKKYLVPFLKSHTVQEKYHIYITDSENILHTS